jgi:3-oxoacyl-[acyl-carrier protein] reductase
MNELSGRTALVTGASRGIGYSCALALAEAGADIAINYHAHADAARELEKRILSLGRRALAIEADVSSAGAVGHLVRTAEEYFGAIDILVNNAGIARVQRLGDVTGQDWDDLIAINLTSCFLVTQAVVPGMRARRWGRIINMSSVAAHLGGIVGPHYAASKAGMLGLTHYYASALIGEGITANAISPALIDTDMVRANLNAAPTFIPVGRFGAVDEVASVVVMLAGNGYVTGQTIHVNGGWCMS